MAEVIKEKKNFAWQFQYLSNAIKSLANSTDLTVSLQDHNGEVILSFAGLNGSHPTVKANQFFANGITPEPFELEIVNSKYRLIVRKNEVTRLENKDKYHVGIYCPSRLLFPVLERLELYFGRITLPPIICIYEERL